MMWIKNSTTKGGKAQGQGLRWLLSKSKRMKVLRLKKRGGGTEPCLRTPGPTAPAAVKHHRPKRLQEQMEALSSLL